MIVFPFTGAAGMAKRISGELAGSSVGKWSIHKFPDGETKVRVLSNVAGKPAAIVCSLQNPNPKFLPLVFLARTLRDLGATSVGLIAPYLAYMRQDKAFQSGESVTARHFGELVSREFQWLATVDPHLHRIHALSEVYSIPTRLVHAAPAMAEWIQEHIERPVLIGPDEESEQWTAAVAKQIGAPYRVLTKTRRGDADVSVSIPDVESGHVRKPVLVDDIISTGRTMIAAAERLHELGMESPFCLGVHALFSKDALAAMQKAPIERIVTCDTVRHATNSITLAPRLAGAAGELLKTTLLVEAE